MAYEIRVFTYSSQRVRRFGPFSNYREGVSCLHRGRWRRSKKFDRWETVDIDGSAMIAEIGEHYSDKLRPLRELPHNKKKKR